jgi:hypothetical protein
MDQEGEVLFFVDKTGGSSALKSPEDQITYSNKRRKGKSLRCRIVFLILLSKVTRKEIKNEKLQLSLKRIEKKKNNWKIFYLQMLTLRNLEMNYNVKVQDNKS